MLLNPSYHSVYKSYVTAKHNFISMKFNMISMLNSTIVYDMQLG